MNLDIVTHSILLHNIFPYVIVISKSPDYDFIKQELETEDEVLYYNFVTGEEYIPRADKVTPSDDNINMIEQEIWQVVDNAQNLIAQKFSFIYEFILVFKRNNYQLLSKTIFCYKIINIDNNKNYTVSSIFDYAKYYQLYIDENGDEKTPFIKALACTSLFSKFIEDSFDYFYRIYVRGETIDPNKDHISRFLKNIVNSYEIMPSSETKRKTFFENNSFKIFSLLSIHKAESERFEDYNKKLKYNAINLEDYFKFYVEKASVKHSSFFYSDRKVVQEDSALDVSMATTTFKSNRSNKGSNMYIGKNYFKPIKTEKLVNVMLKDLNESQIELRQMLDIFS